MLCYHSYNCFCLFLLKIIISVSIAKILVIRVTTNLCTSGLVQEPEVSYLFTSGLVQKKQRKLVIHALPVYAEVNPYQAEPN